MPQLSWPNFGATDWGMALETVSPLGLLNKYVAFWREMQGENKRIWSQVVPGKLMWNYFLSNSMCPQTSVAANAAFERDCVLALWFISVRQHALLKKMANRECSVCLAAPGELGKMQNPHINWVLMGPTNRQIHQKSRVSMEGNNMAEEKGSIIGVGLKNGEADLRFCTWVFLFL